MPRRPTGAVIEKPAKRGTVYALRFTAYGTRQYMTLGTADDGWSKLRAEVELQNVLADIRRGIWKPAVDPAPAPEPRQVPTFHEFASEWFAAQKLEGGRTATGLSRKGIDDLEWRLSVHLLPTFATKRLDAITVEDVDRYRRAKVARGRLNATSINKTLATLSAILEVAVEYELIPRNVAKGRRRRLPAVPPSRTAVDRAEHIVALLDAAGRLDEAGRFKPGQRRVLLATLIYAGLRIGELLDLCWGDVELARGTITVREAKTDAGRRTINILPVLRDELLRYRAALADVDQTALVFGTATGRRQSETNVRRRILAAAVARANAELEQPMTVELTPHSLRRTFASLLFAIGETPPYVMAQMGHTTANLTLAVYARQMDRRDGEPERLKALVEGRELAPIGTSETARVAAEEPTTPARLPETAN
jgi:integrase